MLTGFTQNTTDHAFGSACRKQKDDFRFERAKLRVRFGFFFRVEEGLGFTVHGLGCGVCGSRFLGSWVHLGLGSFGF